MYELLARKRIMVVVAHPDDELLGCGASLHRLITELEATVHCVILGEGVTSRADTRDPAAWSEQLALHRRNITTAGACIGFASHGIHAFPDNRFDSVPLLDLVKVVEQEKRQFQPEVIFTHHGGDTNIDHRRTFDAVIPATRPVVGEPVRHILSFETPSSTEWQAAAYPQPFLPNVYLGVRAEDVEAKVRGMESYELEARPYPHPRSPEALRVLARRHGITVGAELAEAFMLVRSLG